MSSRVATTHDLADLIVAEASAALAPVTVMLPELRMPETFAGHRVDPWTRAMQLWCLGALVEYGETTLGGVDIETRAREAITEIDPSIEAFGCWWYGESLLRLGGLDAVDDPDRAVATVRSPDTIATLRRPDNHLPTNWIFVVTRALVAEQALTGQRPAELDEFLERCHEHLSALSTGWINDYPSLEQFDIYTPDMYVLSNTYVGLLEGSWERGFSRLLESLEGLSHREGAITWGRSIGTLSAAMLCEIAGYGCRFGLIMPKSPWYRRAHDGMKASVRDTVGGLSAAHRWRRPMPTRGPGARLGLTFDNMGKLVVSALALRSVAPAPVDLESPAWPAGDGLELFDPDVNAGAWGYRSDQVEFVLPLLQGFSTDYGPAPRSPGLFEVPTNGPPCFVPCFHDGEVWRWPAGTPAEVGKDPETLRVSYVSWGAAMEPSGAGVPGTREATYRVLDDGTLFVEESVLVDDPGISRLILHIPEVVSVPLSVGIRGDGVTSRRVDTDGIDEWRSFWHELGALHEIEIPLVEGSATFCWSVRSCRP